MPGPAGLCHACRAQAMQPEADQVELQPVAFAIREEKRVFAGSSAIEPVEELGADLIGAAG